MFTYLMLTMYLIAHPTSAELNAQSAFERDLRGYFSQLTGGRDAIGAIHYTHPVDGDYSSTRADRSYSPGIEFEIGYLRVFGSLLCRVGVGYEIATLLDDHPEPAVMLECVPMTRTQMTANWNDDLHGQFVIARAALLGQVKARWSDMIGLESVLSAKKFTFEGLSKDLRATRLFMLGRPNTGFNVVRAVHQGLVEMTFDDGQMKEFVAESDWWTVDLIKVGRSFARGKIRYLGLQKETPSCAPTLLGRVRKYIPNFLTP